MNEEFYWDKENLERRKKVIGPHEFKSISKVGAAIANLKSSKFAGPSDVERAHLAERQQLQLATLTTEVRFPVWRGY